MAYTDNVNQPWEPNIPTVIDPPRKPGLRAVTIKKGDLLTRLNENREKHDAEYSEAIVGYRDRYIKTVTDMVDKAQNSSARDAKDLKRMITLPLPESHLDDYDRVILMLELSVDEEFELTEQEFGQYVMDNWVWKQAFTQSTESYRIK